MPATTAAGGLSVCAMAAAANAQPARIQITGLNGESMRTILSTLLLLISARAAVAQGAPPQTGANQPYVMEYYYKVQWGRQQEFLQLFLKNHYPLLQKNVESGRALSVQIET